MLIKEIKQIKKSIPKKINIVKGLNESTDYGSMAPGELIECENYSLLDSTFTGCTSAQGFERFDAVMRTMYSSVMKKDITVDRASDVPVAWNEDYTDADDTDRKIFREAVVSLGASVYPLGFVELGGYTHAVAFDTVHRHFHIFTEDGGFNLVWTSDTIVEADVEKILVRISSGSMSFFPTSSPNSESAIITTGVLPAFATYWDVVAGAIAVELISSTDLPAPNVPINSIVFNNRLFLGYRGGHMVHSAVGDPLEYDTLTTTAGVWNLGSDLTDFLVMSSSLLITMKRGADIIKLTDPNLVTGVDMIKEPYSSTIDVSVETLRDYFGVGIYCGIGGINLLTPAENSSGLVNDGLTRRIQKTYRQEYENIVCAHVNTFTNQYEVYFSTGRVILLTLDVNKRVKSIGYHDYNKKIKNVYHKKEEDFKYIAFEDDPFVYIQHDNCTSLDGDTIITKLTTAFSSWGAENIYKQISSMFMNNSGSSGQQYYVQPVFDYGSADSLSAEGYITEPGVHVDRYGSCNWDNRLYSSGGLVSDTHCPIYGVGRTVAIKIKTESKFHSRHTIHSMLLMMLKLDAQY